MIVTIPGWVASLVVVLALLVGYRCGSYGRRLEADRAVFAEGVAHLAQAAATGASRQRRFAATMACIKRTPPAGFDASLRPRAGHLHHHRGATALMLQPTQLVPVVQSCLPQPVLEVQAFDPDAPTGRRWVPVHRAGRGRHAWTALNGNAPADLQESR